MDRIKAFVKYFSFQEKLLWGISAFAVVLSFCLFDHDDLLTLAASLIGVSSLILCAKGNPVGQLLMVVFSLLYGIISFFCRYYGEMITYVGMTMPMAIVALISWLRHPYKGNRAQVSVHHISKREAVFMLILSLAVTAVFYFILKAAGTANIVPSTVSVTTTFAAVYLTFRRSPFYALAYGANDVILIILWSLECMADLRYIPVVVCFCAFLINDIYGFISWNKMEKRQSEGGSVS